MSNFTEDFYKFTYFWNWLKKNQEACSDFYSAINEISTFWHKHHTRKQLLQLCDVLTNPRFGKLEQQIQIFTYFLA